MQPSENMKALHVARDANMGVSGWQEQLVSQIGVSDHTPGSVADVGSERDVPHDREAFTPRVDDATVRAAGTLRWKKVGPPRGLALLL